MGIEIVELLHTGVRIPPGEGDTQKALDFYVGLLGMEKDGMRPHIPGIPGAWVNVQQGRRTSQLHIFGAEGQSPVARSHQEDPTRWHLAFSVADLAAAEKELADRGIRYWVYEALTGSGSRQVFLEDPFGNMVELQQKA